MYENSRRICHEISSKFHDNTNISWDDANLLTSIASKAIKQIQLDAFKAGMTEAASIVRTYNNVQEIMEAYGEILSARDNLKEI